jgi:hypothetical protein
LYFFSSRRSGVFLRFCAQPEPPRDAQTQDQGYFHHRLWSQTACAAAAAAAAAILVFLVMSMATGVLLHQNIIGR